MTEKELKNYLITHFPKENERCEWKEFKVLKQSVSGRAGEDVISYISAIANTHGGHLVLGVKDKTLDIVGIADFSGYTLENIRFRVLGNCTHLSEEGFRVEQYQTTDTQKTVWVFIIPRHQYRLPVYAHGKIWQRIDDNLVAITQARLDAILHEVKPHEDWSAEIVPDARIDDLDPEAIAKARLEFIKRNPKYKDEAMDWDIVKFLDKALLTKKGKITRTALILLGREESAYLLDSVVKIRWNLKTVTNQDKDFEIFSIPFILAVDAVYAKIRNLKYRYLRDGTLFPDEFLRYEPFAIREPLHNAIAHQDYTQKAWINVVEFEDDHLVYTNAGSFLPKNIEEVVLKDAPQETYRNPFLVAAMKNLDMIETQGGGIRKIFNFQRSRFFPMPDYDFSDGKVKITITGKILNEDFARILIKNPDLSLEDILCLDNVQKQKPISDEEYKYLKKYGFIEGRKNSVYLSYKVIEPTKDEKLIADYVSNRSFDDQYFKDMIVEYIKKGKKVKRRDIENLILPKLSSVLNEEQRKNKITNLLSSLRMEGKIQNIAFGTWEFKK
jgi:ATP-dependent DNA helicase RecG